MTTDDIQALVGLAEAEARRRVETTGRRFRVLSRDGVSFPSTTDLRDDRVNVHVRAGKVAEAGIG